MSLKNFHYHLIDNGSKQTIFLLHGTGGDETDLLPLVQPFLSTTNIVGLRGNVNEHGMNRFFARNPDGTFIQESINHETDRFKEFLSAWYEKHQITAEQTMFIGYSNGANMILATLLKYPTLIKKAAVLHGMLPFHIPSGLDVSQHQLFVSYGENDQMIPHDLSIRLLKELNEHGGKLEVMVTQAGHSLTQQEVMALQHFIKNYLKD